MLANKYIVRYKVGIEPKKIIDPKVFKEFVIAGGIENILIKAVDYGLIILMTIGSTERILGQYRGGPRLFQSFDGAAALLQQNGITNWSADTTNWVPKTTQKKIKKEAN